MPAMWRIGLVPTAASSWPSPLEPQRIGIGSRLLERVIEVARDAGSRRVWLTTTNDNLDALRFYQRRGFRLQSLRVRCRRRGATHHEARPTRRPVRMTSRCGTNWTWNCSLVPKVATAEPRRYPSHRPPDP